jgi:type I restriction enzyme S subunit
MGGEYDTIPLGEVAAVRSGYAFKSSDWTDNGIPVVKIANVKDGRLAMDGCSFVPQRIADSAAEFALQQGDVVIAMTGYIGDVAIVRDSDLPAVLNQRVGLFSTRDPRRLDRRFLFYLLRDSDVRSEIESLGYGSAQPNVSPSLIHGVEVPIPPLPKQRAIAYILGTLDDKIELNRRMNETLEAMARALFKSWFVDFDPVRAKIEGRWRRGESLPGLPAHLYDLFPNRLVDSELGEIPEGWEVGVLDDLKSESLGGDWGQESPGLGFSEAALCIRGADIPSLQGGGFGKMPTRYLKPSSLEKRRLDDGNLVLEVSGGSPTQSTGRTVLISKQLLERAATPLVCSNFCRLIRCDTKEWSKYLYLWLLDLYAQDQLLQYETGTTGIKNFAFSRFASCHNLVVPPGRVLVEFNERVVPLFARMGVTAAEAENLATIRDALLPKLICGELRVNNGERLLAC